MSKETRGQAIKDRRMHMGYSQVKFADMTGVDRGAVRRAEAGLADERTYVRLETWLDREEARTREVPSTEQGLVEFDLTIEPGARAVVRGPVADAARLRAELIELVRQSRAVLKEDPTGE